MGMPTKNYQMMLDEEAEIQAYTIDKMSTAIVRIMDALKGDEDIFKLLYYKDSKSLGKPLDDKAKEIFEKGLIAKDKDDNQKIKAYPFDPEPALSEGIFIRVYFSDGALGKDEVYSKSQLNLDIICSHDMWLTSDSSSKVRIIRPYGLLNRINKLLTKEKKDKLPVPTGFTHLTVNSKFECLRIYLDTVAIEKGGDKVDSSR